jgi:ubiquinone biosynthesis protein
VSALRNLGRGIAVTRILGRNDASFVLDHLGLPAAARLALRVVAGRPSRDSRGLRAGERLAAAAQEMGPSFIKMGQALSTRPDLAGDEIARDLGALRDRVPPFSGEEARRAIAEQLGEDPAAVFSAFDDEPVAAASIAQVHYATLADGEAVAVKVLRPGIEAEFNRDLDLFQWIAETAERLRPDIRRLEPLQVVRMLRATVDAEMDLRLEAAAASELQDNFEDDPTFRVPDVEWRYTQRRVMTSQRVDGVPLGDRAGLLAAGRDPEAVVRNVLTAFLKQAFFHGFFHADLHHGNLFVDEDNQVIAVDFGIMGRLDRAQRLYVAEMLLAFLSGDYRRAAEVHFEAGYIRRDKSVDAFAQACRSIAKPVFDRPPNEVSVGRLLAQLFRVTESFDMRTQPQLLLLQKTMVVVEGLCRELAPDTNLWGIAREVLEDWAAANLGPAAKATAVAEEFVGMVRRLPHLVEKAELAASAFTEQGVRIHPEAQARFDSAADLDRQGARNNLTVTRILMGVIVALAAVLVVQFLRG